MAVAAKRYISGLWEDVKKEPYTKIFNDGTTAVFLWNIVRLMNVVDKVLEEQAEKLAGRERLIAIHGNRFLLFYVFMHLNLDDLKKEGVDMSAFGSQCRRLAKECLALMTPKINGLFPDSYPGNIFKNQDRQAELLKEI